MREPYQEWLAMRTALHLVTGYWLYRQQLADSRAGVRVYDGRCQRVSPCTSRAPPTVRADDADVAGVVALSPLVCKRCTRREDSIVGRRRTTVTKSRDTN